MKVRVFNHPEGVKILIPVYPEALEQDTQKLFLGIEYFDCDSLELPLRNLSDGTCQRCSWAADTINKKVIVKQPCDCIHNKIIVLNKVLDDPLAFRQEKLYAMLDKELLIRSQNKVK